MKTSLFYWMRYTIIDISYLWVKKVMNMVSLSRRSGMVFKNVSRKSLSNEARNERSFAVVGISRHHHVVSTTKKSTNQGSQEKVDIARCRGKVASTSRIPYLWDVVDSQNPDSKPSPTTSSFSKRKGAQVVPHFHHLLGFQSLKRSLSLFWFLRIFWF